MSDHKVIVKSLSRGNIRGLTKKVRNMTNVANDRGFCVIDWLENKFIPRSDFEFDVVDIESMGDEHALTDHENKMIYIRSDVYERALDGHGRGRMTIVHEVGHCIMHTPERVLYARAFGTARPKAFQDPEWQAKAFAGEFMMPCELIEEGMTVSECAGVFGISLAATKHQIKTFEKDGLLKLKEPVTDVTDSRIIWVKKGE